MSANFTPDQKGYKTYQSFGTFRLFVLENFPFIAEDFDALTYYQMLCKVVGYLQDVITNNESLQYNQTKLLDAFNELQNYVNTYFESLDVQNEINNKLDQMAQDGTLENILMNYVNITKVYDTTIEMLSDTNLINNQKVKTLGYYNINDGGMCEFLITESNNNISLPLNNGLYAELIIKDNIINFKSLGAKSEEDSNYSHFDCKPYLEKYLNFLDFNKDLKLYIPSGIWCFSPTLINRSVNIFGESDYFINYDKTSSTIITAISNQNFVWKLGGDIDINTVTKTTRGINLKNIVFSSGEYNDNQNIPDKLYEIEYGALTIDSLAFSNFNENLSFRFIFGSAIMMVSSWELNFNNLLFRYIYNHNKPIIYFKKRKNVTGVSQPNLSAININYISIEASNGDYLFFDNDSAFTNSHIGTIIAECSFANGYQENGNIGSVNIDGNYDKEESIISGGQCVQSCIDNIILQLISHYYHQVNGYSYIINSVISHKTTDSDSSFTSASFFNININNIMYELNDIPVYIINQKCNIAYYNNIYINIITSRALGQYAEPKFKLLQYSGIKVNKITSINPGLFTNYNLDSFPYKLASDFEISGYSSKVITTNEKAINPLKTTVKHFSNNGSTVNMIIPYFNFKKLYLRYKVNNDAQIFYSQGSISSTVLVNLNATSDFKWVEIDCSSLSFDESDILKLIWSNETLEIDCLYFT